MSLPVLALKSSGAFTLTEIMVVVIILSITASFAIPKYQKAIRSAHERDTVLALSGIQSASRIYYVNNNNQFLSGTDLDLGSINSNFKINIMANGMIYSYTSAAPNSYTILAAWDESGTANDFQVSAQGDSNADSSPCCYAGNCPSLAAC